MLLQYRVKRLLGEKMVIWIDPQLVDTFVGSMFPITIKPSKVAEKMPFGPYAGRLVRLWEPFLIPSRFYPAPLPITANNRYSAMKEVIDNRHDFKQTRWYTRMIGELQATGATVHKRFTLTTFDELDCFFQEYVMGLVDSMEQCGYLREKASDVGGAIVSPTGELHKTNTGCHRFATARILGISPIPIRIAAVSREWYWKNTTGREKNRRERILAVVDGIKKLYCPVPRGHVESRSPKPDQDVAAQVGRPCVMSL